MPMIAADILKGQKQDTTNYLAMIQALAGNGTLDAIAGLDRTKQFKPFPVAQAPVKQVPVTPPVDIGAGVAVAAMPNVSIPNIPIPAAPTMPGGITVEQAIAMGASLAPNVNLQPLTQAEIFGSADPRATLGLLPENLSALVDMRAGARSQKAADDAAAVALAKQTQGIDVAQDIAKDIPKTQERKDIAVYGTKAQERLEAQKQQAERNREVAKLKWDFFTKVATKATTHKDIWEQEVARLHYIASQPGGEKQITEAQARIAKIPQGMSDADALDALMILNEKLGALSPEMRAKMSGLIPESIIKDLTIKATRAVASRSNAATGVTFTPKAGGTK